MPRPRPLRLLLFTLMSKLRRPHIILVLLLFGSVVGGVVWYRHQNQRQRVEHAAADSLNAVALIQKNCVSCHGPKKQEGGLRLDTISSMMVGGEAGPAVVMGEPEHSLMMQKLQHKDPEERMPPKQRLTKFEIEAIDHWIAAGAPMEGGKTVAQRQLGDAWSDPENPIRKAFNGQRLDHWSWQKIQDPVPPVVKDTSWVRNPVDAFVLQKLEEANLPPVPEADRPTLIRRLYFDLTGLPPSPEAVAKFVADPSPEAYSKLVTQLMDSPAYGEHWASMWLDVVRYSDSNGFDYDEFRPTAWHFRDYVIAAFNEDKPYAQFVREQLAGDELVPEYPRTEAEQEALSATGFLRVGPYDNSAVKFGEQDRCRAQVMNDLVETTGAAFLGLQLSCCRCHNHKVDPISQEDYYRLRAIFEPTQPNDTLFLDLEPVQEHIATEVYELRAAQNRIDAINEPVAERVKDKKISALTKEDQTFLQTYNLKRTAEGKGRYKNLRSRIEPTLEEIVAGQNARERDSYNKALAHLKELQADRKPPTVGFLVTDVEHPPLTHLLHQGDYTKPREIVVPGVLSILDPNPLPPAKPTRAKSSGRRSALANWLCGEGNPLTTRVIVNRLWNAHFGEALQPTPNDFGYAGARPSNPELLDWLASKFKKMGGSIKKMNQLIVESATYRQGLCADSSDHHSLWQGRLPLRLKAESLRDSMLAVSGLLQPRKGGPPLWPTLPPEVLGTNPGILVENEEKTRGWYPSPPDEVNAARSIYLVNKRSLRNPMLETFDQPESNLSCGRRVVSTVAPQALTMLNSEFTMVTSTAFAKRVVADVGEAPEAQVRRVFLLALQREPESDELTRCLAFLKTHPLLDLCRSVMNLNEFCYVD